MSRSLYCFIQTRNYYLRKTPREWKPDGIKYGKITYYPRNADHKDPPFEPTKLLMVQRVKPYKGNPYWEKYILDALKLNEIASDIAIVKNIPEVCAQLWKIKHLVKITPIYLPEKLPEDSDSVQTWLLDNGKFLLAPKVDSAREKATVEFMNDPKRLDRETLRTELRKRWQRGYNL
ncbi:39S ribosomal protein L30, mitochondrial [Chelonus insularis]|uniref:39S ribosomal protein L30, mitochondrial n=1 Tax=Chelonus insularis TaxID=460826 RepID=UPI00158A810B|nr:39S ribosomal protein L30, mitochondrial [Chelonus insularis]